MRKIKDVLRLKLDAGLSHEQIAMATPIQPSALANQTVNYSDSDHWKPCLNGFSSIIPPAQ
ncbi:hypothetical protein [Ferrovum myxofaciens]|uniref:hypothetical protein n=1 Tax=Ferrovum myxofaciens TaxID=416213 RepID=UPI002353657E|nr:hypothetical protein [Ferrovum myxofaciens]